MNREEIIQILSKYAVDLFAHGLRYGYETNTPLLEKIADEIVSLPPAEGAEQRIRVRNILQDFYRRGEYELEQAEEDIMRLFQPQPTAEGAEEILDKYPHSIEYPSFVHENSAIAAMTEFATLHAQRIADKMVSERLRGELIKYSMYASEQWCDTSDRELSEKNIDKYLSTREK